MKMLSRDYQTINGMIKIDIYDQKNNKNIKLIEKEIAEFIFNNQNLKIEEVINYLKNLFSYSLDGISVILKNDNIYESVFYMQDILTTYHYLEKIDGREIMKIQYNKYNLDTKINAEYFNNYPKVVLTHLNQVLNKFQTLQSLDDNKTYKLTF